MTIGRQTARRIAEITDAQGWGEQGSEAMIEPDQEGLELELEYAEPGATTGRQTTHRIMEITSARGWEEQGSEATIREERRRDDMEGRWSRMEKWMLDNTRENAEVRKELERMRALAQGERKGREKMFGEIRELREEVCKVRREVSKGTGEQKKWLARLGNEIKEGETIGYKNQAAVMDSLSKLHVNHNVIREDLRCIYREITTLETAMGSTVKGAVAEAVGRLRFELRRIFKSLSEDTP